MSWFLGFLFSSFLLSQVKAEFWWTDKNKDEESIPKEIIFGEKSKFVIKEDISGETVNQINVNGYLLNEIIIENNNLQILVIAVHSQSKVNPEHKLRAPIKKTECMIRREDAQTSDHPYFVPECDAAGNYKALQCLYDNRKMCQCWNENGISLSGDWNTIVDCECFTNREKAEIAAKYEITVYIPRCNDDGTYRSKQCSPITGLCWCVNSKGENTSVPTHLYIECHE